MSLRSRIRGGQACLTGKVATAAQFLTLRLSPLGSTHMGCDDSDGPGHAPRYLDVRPTTMYKVLLPLIICCVCSADEGRLHQCIGRIVFTLSQTMTVSVSSMDNIIVIYGNSKMGRVGYPAGKTADSGTKFENEMVPTGIGVVIRIYGELDQLKSAKDWQNLHDETNRTFERVIPTEGTSAIMLTGSYGSDFDFTLVDKNIGLTNR